MIVFAALVAVSAVISRRFVPAFIILGYVASWMMWVPGNERRVLFFYHALGMLLFTALALAYALTAMRRIRIPFGRREISLAPVCVCRHRQRARGVHLLLPDVDGHAAELCRPTDEGLGRRRVTAFLVILDAALTLAAGAALAGLVRTHLTFAERSLIGITSGLLVGTAATYGLALLTGLTTLTVLAGPALVLVVGLLVSSLTVNPRATWHASWVESRDRWTQRIPWLAIGSSISGIAIVAAIFAHTVYRMRRPRGRLSNGVGGLVAAPDHCDELRGGGQHPARQPTLERDDAALPIPAGLSRGDADHPRSCRRAWRWRFPAASSWWWSACWWSPSGGGSASGLVPGSLPSSSASSAADWGSSALSPTHA